MVSGPSDRHKRVGRAKPPLAFGDDPHGMNDARDVAKQCQENVDPKVLPDPDLEEYAKRRQENGD